MKYLSLVLALLALSARVALADTDLKVGDPAPSVVLSDQEGAEFKLDDRRGKWTVLYFYPKADTPGCTKQACTFRDSIQQIRKLGAEVYGISADTVEKIARFHRKNHLNFQLLADPDLKVIKAYGASVPIVGVAKRWTFIVGPDLNLRSIDRDVSPSEDSARVASELKHLQTNP